jgi:hypothetical protein
MTDFNQTVVIGYTYDRHQRPVLLFTVNKKLRIEINIQIKTRTTEKKESIIYYI